MKPTQKNQLPAYLVAAHFSNIIFKLRFQAAGRHGNLLSSHGEREGEAHTALPGEGATRAPLIVGERLRVRAALVTAYVAPAYRTTGKEESAVDGTRRAGGYFQVFHTSG